MAGWAILCYHDNLIDVEVEEFLQTLFKWNHLLSANDIFKKFVRNRSYWEKYVIGFNNILNILLLKLIFNEMLQEKNTLV